MKTILALLVIAACGSKPPPAQPVENKEPQVKDIVQPVAAEARVVARTSSGGVLELAGDREKAMNLANEDMEHHCGPQQYTIVQEGEEAIGAENGGTTTAWRVHYQCSH
jgi:hypothetical protein